MNIKVLINIVLGAIVLSVTIIFGSWFWGRHVILETLEQNVKEFQESGGRWTPTENIKIRGFPFEYTVLISGDIYFDWENSKLLLEKIGRVSESKQNNIFEPLSIFGDASKIIGKATIEKVVLSAKLFSPRQWKIKGLLKGSLKIKEKWGLKGQLQGKGYLNLDEKVLSKVKAQDIELKLKEGRRTQGKIIINKVRYYPDYTDKYRIAHTLNMQNISINRYVWGLPYKECLDDFEEGLEYLASKKEIPIIHLSELEETFYQSSNMNYAGLARAIRNVFSPWINIVEQNCMQGIETLPPFNSVFQDLQNLSYALGYSLRLRTEESQFNIQGNIDFSPPSPSLEMRIATNNFPKFLTAFWDLDEDLLAQAEMLPTVGEIFRKEGGTLNFSIKENTLYRGQQKIMENALTSLLEGSVPLLSSDMCHSMGFSWPLSVEELISRYHGISGQNNPVAQLDIGYAYLDRASYEEAYHWFKKAADQDLDLAYYALGYLYFHGLGRPLNQKIAREYIDKAFDLGLSLEILIPKTEMQEYFSYVKELSIK